jgi:hypothetical protein
MDYLLQALEVVHDEYYGTSSLVAISFNMYMVRLFLAYSMNYDISN